MQFFEKDEEEIVAIANPFLSNLVEGSNQMDYQKMSKRFSKKMLVDADESNLRKQWEDLVLTSLSSRREYLGCLYRGRFITVMWKQLSFKVQGDYLARLVLGTENDEVKVFGATIS